MELTDWVPLATAVAGLVAATVTYVIGRRASRTTWSSKTAEWQYASVVAFFDAAMDFFALEDRLPGSKNGGVPSTPLDDVWT
ncbi:MULTISPECIES: hypothetical protein [unclassified Streptomyces]|uniref:hypothetical protein n=1 Tax=unclassified Streptomyces TaxID=2593676 RepID=UPI0035DFB0DE